MGIDPGTAITGYGIIEECRGRLKPITYGSIKTPSDHSLPDRLKHIYDQICLVVDEFQPKILGIEQVFFSRNVTSAISVGHARGVVILACTQKGLEIHEYTPTQVKLAVTGTGSANKDQVGYMVRALLGLRQTPRPDDVADALAIAICHAHSRHASSWSTPATIAKLP